MIRLKNLDLNTPGMKRQTETFIGDCTATIDRIIFVAPVECTLDTVDVFTRQAVNQATSNSVTINSMRVSPADASATIIAANRGNSANGVSSTNDINANARYRLTPSANNSLTVGSPIMINFSQQGSGVLSAVYVICSYTPFKHRETR